MKILHIDASIRKESRTRLLSNYLISKLDGDISYLSLTNENIPSLNEESLKKRDNLIYKKEFDNEIFKYARDFKDSDIIVITAPFYDLSFPSLLKTYFENINVSDLIFQYVDGFPKSLAKPKTIYYVTTSGGYIDNLEFSYGYVKSLGEAFYNAKEVILIKAEGLDIDYDKVDEIIDLKKKEIDKMFGK